MRSILPIIALPLAVSAPALAYAQPVAVAPFKAVQLRGGGDVSIVPGPVQRVTILNGSTQFTRFHTEHGDQLVIDACNAQCPHNYNLRIQIESPRVPTVAVQAGGTIVVRPGFAPQRDIVAAVSAGGTIDLRALAADRATAAVHAGGDIYVRPRASLTAAVNSGGDIHYSGHPAVTMAVQGGGDVRRDD
jgi:hypothetical protein